jgi:hypothetical protein
VAATHAGRNGAGARQLCRDADQHEHPVGTHHGPRIDIDIDDDIDPTIDICHHDDESSSARDEHRRADEEHHDAQDDRPCRR